MDRILGADLLGQKPRHHLQMCCSFSTGIFVNWIYFSVPEYSYIPGVNTSTAFQSGWLDWYVIFILGSLTMASVYPDIAHIQSHLPFCVLSQSSDRIVRRAGL